MPLSLVAQYRIGDYAPVPQWFVTCRIKEPEQAQAATVDLDKLARNGPVVCCRADYFMPPGLFSSLQAAQILRLKLSGIQYSVTKADSAELHIVLPDKKKNITALTGQQQQTNAGQDVSEHQCCLYLQAGTLPLLTTLCCDFEGIVRAMFPGLMCTFSFFFLHQDLKAVFEWHVGPCSNDSELSDQASDIATPARWKKARGRLGYMLLHGLKMQSNAELVPGLDCEEHPHVLVDNIFLCEVLHPLATAARPFFFLSYSWDDQPSALSAAADRVLGGLVDLVEDLSGQDAFVSTKGEFGEAACCCAQKVIAVLSPAYLASRTSLLELGAALEARLARNVPLLAVTVDAQVHACITRSCDNWAALRDEWRVAEATLDLVREKVENGTIRIWRDWEDGTCLTTPARWKAAKEMAMFDLSYTRGAFVPDLRSKFVVCEDGDRPELREERQ